MIAQIYKETHYDYTSKNELKSIVFPDPIIIHFDSPAEFERWRVAKQSGAQAKFNKKKGFIKEEDMHTIHVHFAFRTLLT